MSFERGHLKTGGRRKGVGNTAKRDVREAFARLMESNIENFSLWLKQIAEGIQEPEYDFDGKPVLKEDGTPQMNYLLRPHPEIAMKLMVDMAEFHFPKLARHTIDGTIQQKASLVIEGL